MSNYDDDFTDALRTARQINAGRDAEMVPAYSTADYMRGLNPLAGVGSRLGTKRTTAAEDEAARQRFLDAEHKPTLIGKALGSLGIDASGDRARTSWGDAALSSLHAPSRFIQAGVQALTAPSRTQDGGISYYDTVIPQRDSNGNEYISDMSPIQPGTAIPEGLNVAGVVASSSPVAGVAPSGSAGMFAGRLAKTADHAALAKAEKMAAEGLPREQIWQDTGWFQGKDGKWRFEIDDSGAKWAGPTEDAAVFSSLRDVMPHHQFEEAYPKSGDVLVNGAKGSRAAWFDPWPAITIGGAVPNKGSSLLHEMQHLVQEKENFARGSNPNLYVDDAGQSAVAELMARATKGMDPFTPEAQAARDAVWKTIDANRDALGIPTALYRMNAGEAEARAVQKRADLTPDERRSRAPWLDYDIPESQQIVRGVSSNPDDLKASIPGTILRQSADDPDLAGALRIARDMPPSYMSRTMSPEPKMVVRGYHGTGADDLINMPLEEKWALGSGPWGSSSPRVAETYSKVMSYDVPKIVPLEYRFQNPKVIDAQGRRFGTTARSINSDIEAARAREAGHDGLVIRNFRDAVGQDLTQADTYAPLKPGTTYSATTGDLLYSNPKESAALGSVLRNEDPVKRALSVARNIDPLGYYSKLDEVLGSLGPKDKVTSDTLQKRGVKLSEIEARGLKDALADGKAVSAGDLVKAAGKVELREVVRRDPQKRSMADLAPGESFFNFRQPDNPTKWSTHSLDPSNPTYRETVIHLPESEQRATRKALEDRAVAKYGQRWIEKLTPAEMDELENATKASARTDFRSGHFPEPNIVGHMMTSMTKHEGKPVYTIDQIQSDWGQKLRDGGVRDEAKIAELKRGIAAQQKNFDDALEQASQLAGGKLTGESARSWLSYAADGSRADIEDRARLLQSRLSTAQQGIDLRTAELRTAEAATPGHPLVNTTDQWTTTTLRRALKQAVDADAAYIAIPHGDTVLSYNPGDTHGMREFYGTRTANGIVPKNLRNILSKIDKDSPAPVKVEKLETSQGAQGWQGDLGPGFRHSNIIGGGADKAQTGFTLFPITDKIREAVKGGQPLFSNARPSGVPGVMFRDDDSKSAMDRALKTANKYDPD